MIIKNWLGNEPRPTVICVSIATVSLILSLGGWLRDILPLDIAWLAIILCGIPIICGAAVGLFRDKDVTADLLVSIALIASVATGEYFAAGEVAFIMQIGSLLEDFTAGRARRGIEKLIMMTPRTAHLKTNDGTAEVPAEDIKAGDVITVFAGETIPVDGVLLSGSTTIDQSAMTGESMPVDKATGDQLISGTVNLYGVFDMRAAKDSAGSSLQRMIKIAEEADADKAPIVALADKWAGWLVFAALTAAVLTGLFTGQFMRAVTVLVVFCPCAFVLATPTAVAAAIGNLTRYGVLVRTGDALQRLAEIDSVAFDKTGTLTTGKPQVTAVRPLAESFDEASMLQLAASAESGSEHPLGKAIVKYFQSQVASAEGTGGNQGHAHADSTGAGASQTLARADDVQVLAGAGISASVSGHQVIVGKPECLTSHGIDISDAVALTSSLTVDGATVVLVSSDGKLAGLIALADTPRTDAPAAVANMKEMSIEPILLTGDNRLAAGSIAQAVGIENVRSELMPEDKLKAISEAKSEGRKICMVGDGVNDALALRSAYAGVAMGGVGSDIAVESSDAVLVNDDIIILPYLFDMTRRAMAKVKQNIIFSLIINSVAVGLSVAGILNPVTGALFHNCGSVFVVVNAALLLTRKPETKGKNGAKLCHAISKKEIPQRML